MTIDKQLEGFRKLVESSKTDVPKALTALGELKVAMLDFEHLSGSSAGKAKELEAGRDILELGCLLSIKMKDLPGFERNIAQLKTYYSDYAGSLKASPRQDIVLGLNLLRLLTQNRIAEFHVELETLSAASLKSRYVSYPIDVERALMEGNYASLWASNKSLPDASFAWFVEELKSTIRDEVAACSAAAYETLPVSHMKTALSLSSSSEVATYAKNSCFSTAFRSLVLPPKDGDKEDNI